MQRIPGPKGQRSRQTLATAVSLIALVGSLSSQAGSLSYNFTTDPAATLTFGGNSTEENRWVSTGGNPGGFLAITYPVGNQKTSVVFPDTDPGKVVTGFSFSCDLRVGNPTGDRAADGFSISFARDGDPILEDAASDQFGGTCCAETGTKTGIAVSFDTWAGNTFPNDPKDKADIEGFIIRVDDVTVKKIALPTRNGLADDLTSLQTGPRDATYWAGGTDPSRAHSPESWAGLAWKPFSIDLTTDGKLTVKWKGKTFLDKFQTAYFRTGGRLVLAGRTGGANEHTHVDNIVLTTTAASCASAPTVPGNVRVSQAGARRAVVAWDASSIGGDPAARVGYEIQVDGVDLPGQSTATTYELTGLAPSKTYAFKVRAKNVCGDTSAFGSVSVTTVAEVDSPGILSAQVYRTSGDGTAFGGAGQDGIDTVLADPKYPNSPDNVYYVNGLQFGEPAFGNTYGENHMVRIAGVLTAPKSGNFRFFVRSDDASRLYLNTAGAAIPNAATATIIAQENGCCGGFEAPGAGANADDGTFPTSEPISLTAGKQYGVLFLVKEGGGGDWGQVGWREEGTSAISVITGPILSGGKGDPIGAVANITQQPASSTVAAYLSTSFTVAAETASPYGKPAFYQWYKNGAVILGANSPTYSVAVAQPGDDGAKFKALVGVVGKTVESAEATLTVTTDQPPTVTRISGSDTFDSVTVTFNEPVTDPTATDKSNYQITGLSVQSAIRLDVKTIQLSTSKQVPDRTHTVTIKGVKDIAGLATDYTGAFATFKFKTGIAFFGTWQGENGGFNTWIDSRVKNRAPTTTDIVADFLGFSTDTYDDYFGQTKSLFIAPKTGDYVFFMASDDHGELYLSTDENPANKKLIAQEPVWGGRRYFIGDGSTNNSGSRGGAGALSNRSDQFPGSQWPGGKTIHLTQGKQYYLELLYKEGVVGDHGSATYRLVTDAELKNGESNLKGDVIGWYYDPTPQSPTVVGSEKRSQTISFALLPDTNLGDPPLELNATASSGLPVSFSVVSGPVTLSGNRITGTGSGTAIVRASQAGDSLFSPAPGVERSFVVRAIQTGPTPGDLNHDGIADILFQDDDGYLAAWFMKGTSLSSAGFLLPSNVGDAGFRVVATGDFNRDGSEDIVFQHKDGTLAIWFMKGTIQSSAELLNPRNPGDPRWRVVGVADLNNDGKPDLVFQHTDGTLAVWFMDGTSLSSASVFNPSNPGDPRWRVVGLADLNADGKTDLIFQHADGTLAVWTMDGIKLLSASLLSPSNPGAGWRLAGIWRTPRVLTVTLTGASERPTATATAATGLGRFTLVGSQLSFQITYSGLSGVATAAHIHLPASTEQTAGVVINFRFVSTICGCFFCTNRIANL